MDPSGIIASWPLIATAVGVVSGAISIAVYTVQGFRRVRQRSTRTGTSAVEQAPPGTKSTPLPAHVAPTPGIRTPDQRLRVFVSSTLQELSEERVAARQAISRLRLIPVLFELG